ncbi:MAG: glycosyltransferase family 2 protein [Planctomycetota bacterium]
MLAPSTPAPAASPARLLTALPVYNEVQNVEGVLGRVLGHADDVLVIDDGSTDGTGELLARLEAREPRLTVKRHPANRGYGAALRTAFCYAQRNSYDVLVTIDCDGQHEPQHIRELAAACSAGVDIVSGSRYLPGSASEGLKVPVERRRINHTITAELNARLGLDLTDAFCGFKAYRVASLGEFRLQETGYAMPLELWVQGAAAGMRVIESAVPRIYLDEARSFGGELDNGEQRLRHYREVVARAAAAVEAQRLAAQPAIDPCVEALAAIAD